ncbi:uncharacterized protein GGS22DRAFT_186820 [Annulohypoxylon maeteangense]|uniref:uncharacterized protein n=1 Tax=Annulohypoxylon maeteangense TaxID=1927788 RepID=UPI0020076E92|nr:uncharacterized protein GGS22DRAFT_186820 [Annulohypoxylon maeteangense]KAI0886747.1 hypothetical protein GGS22DRAFT_186820 [Annulohypoxylon maeteangense]
MSEPRKAQSAIHDGLELYIPSCILEPPHCHHPPPPDKPLRIRIQGPLETIEKLLPNESWYPVGPFPQPGGIKLADLTHRTLYGEGWDNAAIAVRDEYNAWVMKNRIPQDHIDYYGVTLDHLVPKDDPDPEVLCINIIEVDEENGGLFADGGKMANECLLFPVDPKEYTGKKVLAVPRCCQKKRGTTDRKTINGLVEEMDIALQNPETMFKGVDWVFDRPTAA